MNSKELPAFDVKLLKLMSTLLEKDAVDEMVMGFLNGICQDFNSLISKNKYLESQVQIDSKTSLLKYSEDYIPMILKSASRVADNILNDYYNLSYVRFDIDDFSYVNNRYGHDIGDIVLVGFADILRENSRPTDYVMRYGGEEFDVILPGTDINGALSYLTKIFSIIDKHDYFSGDDYFKVTASAGVSTCCISFEELKVHNPDEMKEIYLIIQKYADDALYDAKVSGKSRFKVYNEDLNYTRIRKIYSEHKLIQSVS